jgi:multidrug efflux pump subunit AcrA (membrane-fusion protein)
MRALELERALVKRRKMRYAMDEIEYEIRQRLARLDRIAGLVEELNVRIVELSTKDQRPSPYAKLLMKEETISC